MGNSTWSRWCRAFGVNPGGIGNKQAVPNNFDHEESNDNSQTDYNNQEAGDDYNGEVYHDFTQAKHNNEYFNPVQFINHDGIDYVHVDYLKDYDDRRPCYVDYNSKRYLLRPDLIFDNLDWQFQDYDFKLLGVHQLDRPTINYDNVFTADDNGNLVSYNDYLNSAEFHNISRSNHVDNDCE